MLIENSPIPLYKQLKDIILEEVKSLEANSQISSDREYSKEYKVSRITVRRAIDELVQEKYLVRIVGKGTYVSNLNKSSEFIRVISFTDDMRRYNFDVSSKVLNFEAISPDKMLIEKLKIKTNDNNKVFRLKRLRYANNIPMAIQDSYIIYNLCPDLLKYDFSKDSLYRVLEDDFNLKLLYASNILGARMPTKEESSLFKFKDEVPVFFLEQITILKNGNPIEYVLSIYRSDKYKFSNIAFGRG